MSDTSGQPATAFEWVGGEAKVRELVDRAFIAAAVAGKFAPPITAMSGFLTMSAARA